MITEREVWFISICVEGFFYGIYFGIFAIYLQCPSKESRTATILFYALCLLYVLSTVAFVGDWVFLILENGIMLRIRTLPLQPQIQSEPMLLPLFITKSIVNGCCDFIAQCILIYRCWIVWSQNIHVVIMPSFLAIVYLATWIAPAAGGLISILFVADQNWFTQAASYIANWQGPLFVTSATVSLAVNALVTGLIVFKILMVFFEVKATVTSVERTLGSTGGTKLQHIIFVIIESGMALFAVQLFRVLVAFLPMSPPNSFDFVVVINQMLNGITPTIILVRVSMRLSFNDKESFNEAVGSLRFNNPPSDQDADRRMGTLGSSGGMLPQERSQDIVEDVRS